VPPIPEGLSDAKNSLFPSGEIYGVVALKPASELELTLKENDHSKDGFLQFETKDSKKILINYTNKYI